MKSFRSEEAKHRNEPNAMIVPLGGAGCEVSIEIGGKNGAFAVRATCLIEPDCLFKKVILAETRSIPSADELDADGSPLTTELVDRAERLCNKLCLLQQPPPTPPTQLDLDL